MLALVGESAPFAHVLHPEVVEKLARGAALARGRAYAATGRVTSLAKKDRRLVAFVRGTADYAVSIWVNGDRLGYTCSCPAGAEGDFCKHCVAVAIVWLESHG
jgi:uncharacterized Zn finger protein